MCRKMQGALSKDSIIVLSDALNAASSNDWNI